MITLWTMYKMFGALTPGYGWKCGAGPSEDCDISQAALGDDINDDRPVVLFAPLTWRVGLRPKFKYDIEQSSVQTSSAVV